MTNLQSFLHMGGYGAYVWSAYAVTFIVIAVNIVAARVRLKSQLKRASLQLNKRNQNRAQQ